MTTRRKPDSGPEPNLPITPMLDMAFQLLAFFVMTYHPSDLEGQMDLSLPSEELTRAEKPEQTTNAPTDQTPINLPANLTVIVRTQMDDVHTGQISDVRLQDDAGTQQVEVGKLLEELKKQHETVENKENIKIQADGKLKWQAVIQVMDACQQAGFKNISFVPPPNFHMSGQ
ncbi:MAG TPA: biopolymer transporter ExbD [Gemmataceae bacterium]|nr:biopolymer transporter ExbD [Gemmataceae bacterium]